MPKLILDGESRGAVRAVADVTKANKELGKASEEAGKIGERIYRTSADAAKRAAAEEKKRAAEMDARIDRQLARSRELRQEYQRQIADERKLAAETRKTTEAAGGGMQTLVSRITDFATAAGAISLVNRGLQDMEQQAQRAADAVMNSVGSAGMLQQLPNVAENLAYARGLVNTGVADSAPTALGITFDLASAGYTREEMHYLREIGEQKLVKGTDLARYAGGLKKYQATFGLEEAGDIRQVGSKLLQAAETAQTDVVPLAIAATQFGSEAKALGMTDEQAVAGYLSIESRAPGPEEAATRYRALLSQIDKRGLWQGDLERTLTFVDREIATGKSAYDVLGEVRAVAGFRNLWDGRAEIAQQEKLLQRANTQDLVAVRGGQIMRDPVYAAAVERQRAEGSLAIVEESRDAERENLFAAVRAHRVAGLKSRGQYHGPGWIEDLLWSGADTLGMENAVLRDTLFWERHGGRDDLPAELESRVADYLDRQTQAIERQTQVLESIDAKTKTTPPAGGPQE